MHINDSSCMPRVNGRCAAGTRDCSVPDDQTCSSCLACALSDYPCRHLNDGSCLPKIGNACPTGTTDCSTDYCPLDFKSIIENMLGSSTWSDARPAACTEIFAHKSNGQLLPAAWDADAQVCNVPVDTSNDSVVACEMACATHIADFTTKEGMSCFQGTANQQMWNLNDECSEKLNNWLYMCHGAGSMCDASIKLADPAACIKQCAANLSGFTQQPAVLAMVQPGGACDKACADIGPYMQALKKSSD